MHVCRHVLQDAHDSPGTTVRRRDSEYRLRLSLLRQRTGGGGGSDSDEEDAQRDEQAAADEEGASPPSATAIAAPAQRQQQPLAPAVSPREARERRRRTQTSQSDHPEAARSPATSAEVPPEEYAGVARWSLLDAQFSNAGAARAVANR